MAAKLSKDPDNVVPIRPRVGSRWFSARDRHGAPVDDVTNDLAKYARGGEPDDYRHRMTMNAAGFAAAAILVVIGIWLADSIAQMRQNQDCVLTGRRGCTPVAAPPSQRW
jgi:hypothetical protein